MKLTWIIKPTSHLNTYVFVFFNNRKSNKLMLIVSSAMLQIQTCYYKDDHTALVRNFLKSWFIKHSLNNSFWC